AFLSHQESDDALVEVLEGAAAALAPGGVLVWTAWHPRLADGAPLSFAVRPVPPSHGWPAGSARLSLVRARAPLPRVDLVARVDDERGLPLAETRAGLRLLTLAEERAVL